MESLSEWEERERRDLGALSRLGTIETVCTLEAKDVVAEKDGH